MAATKTQTANQSTARDPRVDAYIAKAQPFAQTLLNDLRAIVREAAPRSAETIKWGMPFFTLVGAEGKPIILGNMAAFKTHCSFGLWGKEVAATLIADGIAMTESEAEHSMGSFGRITSAKDLPSRAKMLRYVKQAAAAIETGTRTKSLEARKPAAHRVAKPEAVVPEELTAALRKNAAAAKTFAAFSASSRREYTEWIADAKRADTKAARIAQAVAWMAEGKRRHWKYEK
jgi:uncharacterized protein YdeI (YjbR/CyaY-like superfamily)